MELKSMIEKFFFCFLSALVLIPAVLVVTTKNVFHSALWLIVSLVGVAGVFAMLAADFLFAVQLLVYVGGIMVLLLFVILLSGRPSDWEGKQINEKGWLAALFSLFLVAAIGSTVAVWPMVVQHSDPQTTTAGLGQLLLTDMLFPFKLISVVLVAALVGAIYFSVRKSSQS
jgi:NADH-quinone oxidoreductase subunit J